MGRGAAVAAGETRNTPSPTIPRIEGAVNQPGGERYGPRRDIATQGRYGRGEDLMVTAEIPGSRGSRAGERPKSGVRTTVAVAAALLCASVVAFALAAAPPDDRLTSQSCSA